MALKAQLGEHCTGIAEVVGSNPAQSLKNFSGLCSSSVTAALALMTVKQSISALCTYDFPNYFHGISLSDLAHILCLQDDMWAGKADTIK